MRYNNPVGNFERYKMKRDLENLIKIYGTEDIYTGKVAGLLGIIKENDYIKLRDAVFAQNEAAGNSQVDEAVANALNNLPEKLSHVENEYYRAVKRAIEEERGI